jgi:hypothetical protein
MPITPFLSDQAFDPETVEAMGEAFATTCEALGLSDRADAMTQVVAEKIIELARLSATSGHRTMWLGEG